jgi:hypothetical protein
MRNRFDPRDAHVDLGEVSRQIKDLPVREQIMGVEAASNVAIVRPRPWAGSRISIAVMLRVGREIYIPYIMRP